MEFRAVTAEDVPALFVVRVATRENALSREALARQGVTEESLRAMLGSSHRGWLCQADGRVVGFAMGNGTTGELWVLAVLPEYEGRGIGSRLLRLAEDWLWSLGWAELWLWTSPQPGRRARQLYGRRGWTEASVRDGRLLMKKTRPG
ncbi:MAG: GNAT family N-acetyltransferase [Opitutaceae bacterium]|nr:GNAT family N-acetyltransferase [Opitutaceae bacterium]